ncbi:hypothetical protein [Nocardia wallacei]|uniref:hypothetical protein n=1 Tax=Nocardia wallacei TaxID=480035 RepID=UPI0024571192|nr:hypothetical protein [Nocardia wallacei]
MSDLLGAGVRQWRKLSDGSVWPVIEHGEDVDSVEWRLRHATLTREDAMYAASVMAAYNYLVYEANRDKAALVRRELRAGFRNREETPDGG